MRRLKRTAVVLALTVVAGGLAEGPTQAAFPGQNGKIAFTSVLDLMQALDAVSESWELSRNAELPEDFARTERPERRDMAASDERRTTKSDQPPWSTAAGRSDLEGERR